MSNNYQQEKFHEDPAENLRLENEILQLKMQAELGASIQLDEDLPPEIEAAFLSHVYDFEKALQNVSMKTVYELLDQPPFPSLDQLNESQVQEETNRLIEILSENNMSIEMPTDKSAREVYKFITEYLFDLEIEDIQLDGLCRHFIFNEQHLEDQEDDRSDN